MVKVAMIGHKDFPSRSGGVEVMVGGLARSLVERGYDVTVYNRGLEKHHNVYDVDGVHARRVFTLQKPALNATIYSFLATFDALFRGYDVIHYHAIGPSVPLLIAKIFGKRTVCTVHGLNWKVDKWRGFASRYMKLGERIAAKYADDLVVLSETEWNYFLQKYDRASILIPNAIRFYEKRACSLIRENTGWRGESTSCMWGASRRKRARWIWWRATARPRQGKSLYWSARWMTANIAEQYSSRHRMTLISS